MLVLPADAYIDPDRTHVSRDVLRAAADHLATGAFGIDDPLVTLGVQVTGPATEYGYLLPDSPRGEEVAGLEAYPLQAFEEKPSPARAEELPKETGVAWNAGMFLWRRRAIRAALERYTGLVQTHRPDDRRADAPPARVRVRSEPVSIDYAVMEGAARERPGGDGLDGRRLVRPRLVDGAARPRSARAATGAVVQAGRDGRRRRRTTSSSGATAGASGSSRPLERGSMTATQPIAVLARRRARHRARRGAHRALRRTRRMSVTTTAGAPAPTTIVFGTDGWRARIADEYTFENVRRCADGVARYVVDRGETGQGRRHRVRPPVRLGALRGRRRRGPPRPRHPGRASRVHAVPTQMSSFEVVERGSAAGIVITASHNPWVDNGFKVKAPTGAAAGADILGGHRGAARRSTAATRSSAGRSPTPRRPGWSSGSTRSRATSGSSGGRSTSTRCGRRTCTCSSIRCGAPGAGWISRLLAGGRIRVNEIHQERNPFFGGVNPEPIRPERRRGARRSSRAAATTSACCSTAMPTGRARPTSAARSSTSSR